MRKLRECKNLGELYAAVGEKTWGKVAYALMLLLICVPLVAGFVNYRMLQASYNYITPYDAYEYNYKCMSLWNVIFSLMMFCVAIYWVGRIENSGWGTKGFVNKLKERQPWFIWWILLLIWTVIPVVCSIYPKGAILGVSQLGGGYISHFHMLGVMGCAFMISESKQREDVMWAFISITDILSVIMIAFEYDLPIFRWFSGAPGISVYTNSNHYGYIITMAYLASVGMYYMCLYNEDTEKCLMKKSVCVISLILQSFAIVVNDTLGSYLGIVFALIVIPFLWGHKPRRIKIWCFLPHFFLLVFTLLSYWGFIYTKLGSSIGSSLVVFYHDLFRVSQKSEGYQNAGTDRIGLWIATIKKIVEKPIIGYGPDIIVDKNNNYIIPNTPHNEFLECAFFMGIPGLVLYLGGLIHLFIIKIRRMGELKLYEIMTGGVIIAYLASAFFGVRKFNTACYFFMFIGLLVGSAGDEKHKNLRKIKNKGTEVKKN